MAAQKQKWVIRNDAEHPTFSDLYGSNFNTCYTSLQLFHGGQFTPTPGRDYIRHKVTFVDFVQVHKLSYELLSDIIKALNYNGKGYFYRIEKKIGLDLGLIKLENKYDFEKFIDFIFPQNCNQAHTIYIEVDRKSQIACFPNSLRKANKQVMEKLLFDFVVDNPHATIKQAREYVFNNYGVWITPYYLKPGLDSLRTKLSSVNGDD